MNDSAPTTGDAAAPAPADANAPNEKKASVSVTIAGNSVWLLIDTLAGMAASFYSSILVARRLGPDFMGQYNFVLTFAFVLRMFTEIAIPTTVRKYAAELMGREDYVMLKTLVRNAMRLQARLATVGVTGGLVYTFLFFPREQRVFAVLAVLTIIPGLFLSVPTGALWATEKLRHNVVASLTATSLNMLGVTASVIFGWGMVGLMASLLTSRVVDCVVRYRMFKKLYARLPGKPIARIDPALRKRIIPFAALEVVNVALYTALFDRSLEVFFLKALAPFRQIAFFGISFTLVQYLLLLPQQLSGSVGASMMVKQGRSPTEAARLAATATWFMMLLATPELFGVAAISGPLLQFMYGAKYLSAIPVLTVQPLFGLSLAVSQPSQFLLVTAEKQVYYIIWLAIAVAIAAAGNYLLIPHFGALGAAYAKGVAQLVGATAFLAFMVGKYKVTLPFGRMAKLLFACAAMFVGVKVIGRALPPLPALLVGVPFGVSIFAILVRWLRCLDDADRYRLGQLERMFPGRARGLYRGLLQFLVPARAPRPPDAAVAS
jgi:O-antigen/teichoic acid export membrane protein